MTNAETIIDAYLDAYSDADAVTRMESVRMAWSKDGQLIDPPLEAKGHEAIAALSDAVQQHYPNHRFQRTTVIDTHHDVARYGWQRMAPDGTVALTGTDVATFDQDGRLQRVTGFFGELSLRES